MQFYYNSGLPQRQRRARDRPNTVNRDVPSFLVYPDGSHSLGVIAPAPSGRPDDQVSSNQDSIQGPFVVWADPAPPPHREAWNLTLAFFYVTLVISVIMCVLILADSVKGTKEGDHHLSAPPLELPALLFSLDIAVKCIGLWGVYKEKIRYLSIFIAISLALTVLSFFWIGKHSHLSIILFDLVLIGAAARIRSCLMGQWFSASTR